MEFNIVESGTSPREAMLLLFEAVEGYVESAKKIKARPAILNQKSDPEYEEMCMYHVGRYAGAFRQVSVPFHGSRAIKPRTLKSIVGQSGIPWEEWLKY